MDVKEIGREDVDWIGTVQPGGGSLASSYVRSNEALHLIKRGISRAAVFSRKSILHGVTCFV
jgi:hypothetical protein